MINDDEQIRGLLKQAISRTEAELQRDLWPEMLQRLAEHPHAAVPWFDWALLAAMLLLLVFAPKSIPVLLYHL
jgi:hypothetical protein